MVVNALTLIDWLLINVETHRQQADVFSYGIVLCEIIARVEADPDMLPRTKVGFCGFFYAN